jgi:hypothetical protein
MIKKHSAVNGIYSCPGQVFPGRTLFFGHIHHYRTVAGIGSHIYLSAGTEMEFGSVVMPAIVIPFIFSSEGIADSIFLTVGSWVIIFFIIMTIAVIYGLFTGDIPLPRIKITARNISGAVQIVAAGVIAFLIHPLLLLPLLAAVIAILVYLEVGSMNPDPGPAGTGEDYIPRQRYVRPKPSEDTVIDAEFQIIDERKKDPRARPARAGAFSDTADRKRAEEQRTHYEEQKKREQEQKLKARERERLRHIHGLYDENFQEYLKEADKFRKEFGKNVQCDICGRWDEELFVYRNQTYCARCLPPGQKPGT